MPRFHANAWVKGLGKLQALRKDQLWLMREGGKRGISLPHETEDAAAVLLGGVRAERRLAAGGAIEVSAGSALGGSAWHEAIRRSSGAVGSPTTCSRT
jgi:hypothetical protein